MAKKKKAKKGGKGGQSSGKAKLAVILLLAMSAVFVSSALILFVGMLPAFVAFFVDRNPNKTRAMTVAAMNLAGCMPFLFRLWSNGSSLDAAMKIILDPISVSVIYAAAAAGYCIDWGVSIMVSGVLYQRGKARKKAIEKRQKQLVERWGIDVKNL